MQLKHLYKKQPIRQKLSKYRPVRRSGYTINRVIHSSCGHIYLAYIGVGIAPNMSLNLIDI